MIYKNIRNEINVNTSTVQSLTNNSEKENLESWNLKLPKKLYLKFSTVSWKTLQKKKKKTFIVRFIKRNMITSTTGEGYKASRENAIKRNRKSITHWGAIGNRLANYRQTFYLPLSLLSNESRRAPSRYLERDHVIELTRTRAARRSEARNAVFPWSLALISTYDKPHANLTTPIKGDITVRRLNDSP